MERRMSYPDNAEEDIASTTQSDMHEFSISSLISNVSKLLEGNNSSFLVHVNSNRASPNFLNSKSSSKLKNSSESDSSEIVLDAPEADIFVPSTPINKKLGNREDISNMDYSNCDDSKRIFSVAELITRVEGEMKTRPHQLVSPKQSLNEGFCIPSTKQNPNSFTNSGAEENETPDTPEFVLTDIFNDIKNQLPHRRFPAPELAPIFEQSCEDMSVSSRSRASSVASSVSKGPLSNTNIISKPVGIRSLPSSAKPEITIKRPSNSCDRKKGSRNESRNQDSKIPVPMLVHLTEPKEKMHEISSHKQLDFSIFPKENSSFTDSLQQTVVMAGAVDFKRDSKKAQNPFVPSVSEWMNVSSITNAELENQRSDETDSWDEFDRIMDKSLPPKEWEIHEFEELAVEQKNKSVIVEKTQEVSFEYFSAGDAKILMDKEEEDRVQFLRSTNASFVSVGEDSVEPAPGTDIFSMTNYFQLRSSFPIDNQANESSMFHADYTARQDEIQQSVMSENESVEKDVTVTSHSNTIFEPKILKHPSFSSQIQSPSILNLFDSKAQKLARFLMGTESNGIEKNSIMDHVLEMCKRRSSYGISIQQTGQTPNVASVLEQNKTVMSEAENGGLQRQDVDCVPIVHELKYAEKEDNVAIVDEPKMYPCSVTPSNANIPICSVPAENERLRKISRRDETPRNPAATTTKKKHSESYLIAKNSEENDTSVMLSEHGKEKFYDDVDIETRGSKGFDEFKRHLTSVSRVKKDLQKYKKMKENLRPAATSAFVSIPYNNNIKTTSERDNPLRKSAELLRRTAPSPPEKLIVGKPFISTIDKYPNLQEIPSDKTLEQNPSHSTPIAAEPMSVQLAKSMFRDSNYLKPKQMAMPEAVANCFERISSHSAEMKRKRCNIQPVVSSSAFRSSSTPNEFEQRALKTLADPDLRTNGTSDTRKKYLNDSLRSVEVARSYPTRKLTRIDSEKETHLKTKCVSDENVARGNGQRSTMGSLSLSSALGADAQPSNATATSCSHQSLPGSYPAAYGFPVSIHIHLPTMPYLQPQYSHQHGQLSGYDNIGSSHMPQSQGPSSNGCHCQISTHLNKGF